MDASLNAEAFYRRHGYELVEYTTHTMRSGTAMASAKMHKTRGEK